MLDLVMFAITVLCCLLGPADAKRIDIDVLDLSSGEVETLHVERTATGFAVTAEGEAEPLLIRRGEKGTFHVQLPDAENPVVIDLHDAQVALKAKDKLLSIPVDTETVRVSRSKGLSYVSSADRKDVLFVVRAAAAKEKAKTPK